MRSHLLVSFVLLFVSAMTSSAAPVPSSLEPRLSSSILEGFQEAGSVLKAGINKKLGAGGTMGLSYTLKDLKSGKGTLNSIGQAVRIAKTGDASAIAALKKYVSAPESNYEEIVGRLSDGNREALESLAAGEEPFVVKSVKTGLGKVAGGIADKLRGSGAGGTNVVGSVNGS